ncbi:MAG: PLDc N-terminal domain-containing protein [Syntrophobacterales bacterium]|nr:PLDc N-terminal domain-containing protein [Syntrophobacterales bacterium]
MTVLSVILTLLLLFVPLIPTFWAIQDIPKRKFISPKRKIIWFFTVSTIPFFGALVYLIFERKKTEPIVYMTGNNA